MPAPAGVDVHVDEPGTAGRLGQLQACLLCRLAAGAAGQRLPRLEVTARLQPDAQALVEEETHPAAIGGNDDRG